MVVFLESITYIHTLMTFVVLSNAPKKYAVVESKGSIKAHCCVDM